MRKSDERVENFFKKDLYKVRALPDQTNCILGETAFKFDLPLSYGMVVFKVHAAILAYREKAKLPVEKNACCLELYFADDKKSVVYAPTENLEQFNINQLPRQK